jgi:hypothetical protein
MMVLNQTMIYLFLKLKVLEFHVIQMKKSGTTSVVTTALFYTS